MTSSLMASIIRGCTAGVSSKLGFSSGMLINYYGFGKLLLFNQNGITSQNDMVMASILDFYCYRQMEKGA